MYEELLRAGRIHKGKVSRAEIDRAMERASRDLRTAKKIVADDPDWGFAVAYNAVLQASRAYMFSLGYRPSSAEGHKNAFSFMLLALDEAYKDLVTYFDRMRKKRNQAVYDASGLITETEARNLLRMATDFVALIAAKLKEKK
jgi:uncharacterized protein (UPF0332 family)